MGFGSSRWKKGLIQSGDAEKKGHFKAFKGKREGKRSSFLQNVQRGP